MNRIASFNINFIPMSRIFAVKSILWLCLFSTYILSFNASAQQYPVEIQPTVTFPSVFLNDYSDPGNTNIRVYLADLTKTNYSINIKIQLTGTNVSYASTNGITITLNGGQVYFLNNQELATLFSIPGDLQMTGSNQNVSPNILPEGPYSLTLEAFDANLKIPVSNFKTDFTIFTVVLYDPPMLNYPALNQVFDLQTINQNVFFNWTPRQIVYAANQPVQYRFRLIKVIPVDRNPYDAINSTIPAYIDESSLDFPTFIYSPMQLPLQEGSVYAWQVQAYEMINNTLSTARFKNQGFSEVYTFSVKENCDQITAAPPVINENSVTLSWSGTSVYQEYELDYRPMGTNLPWIPIDTTSNTVTLTDTTLQVGVTYEYTVKARCNNWLSSVYGGTFSLPVPDCVAPAPVEVTTTDANVLLTWTAVQGVDSLILNYKLTSNPDTNPYTSVTLDANASSYTLSALSQGGYTIRLDAACSGNIVNGATNSFLYNDNGVVGPCPIPVPFQLMAQRIIGDTASLSWNSISANTGYSITYWDKDSVQSTHTIGPLTTANAIAPYVYDNELYVYQITYMCGTKSTVTPTGMFRITGASTSPSTDPATADCFPPVDLQAQPRSTTSALFDWNSISGADDYQLFYGVKGTSPFIPFTTTATSALIKSLADSQKYQFVVRARCGGLYSIFSDTALVDLSAGKGNPNCDSASFVTPLKTTTTNIMLSWGYTPAITGYLVTYRDTSQAPNNVYTQAFTNGDSLVNNYLYQPDTIKFTFQNLNAGTKYVFTVQALCGTGKAMPNMPVFVSTLPNDNSSGSCGSEDYCNKTDTSPLTSLKVGDTIYCADYQVEVDKLNNTSSTDGMYSGTGHMAMPIPGVSDFVTMSVSFSNVKINAAPNKCIYDGVINIDSINAGLLPTSLRDSLQALVGLVDSTISNVQSDLKQAQGILDSAQSLVQSGINYFQGGVGVGNVKTGALGDSSINTTITNGEVATISNNTITINGVSVTVDTLPVLLQDNSNKVYQVTASGTVTYVGYYDTSFAKSPTPDLSNQIVTFTANPSAVYDFDAWQSIFQGVTQIASEYQLIGQSYYVPAKFITPGALDLVNASISTNASDAQNVVFSNSKGFVYNQNPTGTNFTLNLAGGPASDGQNIYAWYVNGTTKKIIGQLLLPSYAPQTKNVVLIPVKKDLPYDASVFEDYLNQTYGQIGITYNVSVDTSFISNTAWDTNGDGVVQITGSTLLSNDYQGEEENMIQTYVNAADSIDPNTAYILAVYEASNPGNDLLGVMPFQQQFGFLFTGEGTQDLFTRTLAHELGHGAYYMEHTFTSLYLGVNSQGTTKNLMDYTEDITANQLWKYQWDIVNAPGHVWGVLQGDASSQLYSDNYYFDPSGMPFKIKTPTNNPFTGTTGDFKLDYSIVNSIKNGTFPNGAIFGWYVTTNVTTNGITKVTITDQYQAKISGNKFLGYYQVKNGTLTNVYYNDGETFISDYSFEFNGMNKNLYLVEYTGNCTASFFKTEYTIRGYRYTQAQYQGGQVQVLNQFNNYEPIIYSYSQTIPAPNCTTSTNENQFSAGEYASYQAYTNVLGTNAQSLSSKDWYGAWLTSDRVGRTLRWKNAMVTITKNQWLNVLKPFAQVADYYLWAQSKADSLGHQIRWAKGAAYLVADLADSYETGVTTANVTDMGERMGESILSDLNMGIVNFAIGKFYNLFYGNDQAKKTGNAAYIWDLQFIYNEQAIVAWNVYPNYNGTPELSTLQDITQKTGLYGTMAGLIAHPIPNFASVACYVSDPTSRYGELGRINIPLFMLWPSIHYIRDANDTYSNPNNLSTTGFSQYLNSDGTLNWNYVPTNCKTVPSPGPANPSTEICTDTFVNDVQAANTAINQFYDNNQIK
jgi:hypothetical protein